MASANYRCIQIYPSYFSFVYQLIKHKIRKITCVSFGFGQSLLTFKVFEVSVFLAFYTLATRSGQTD